MKETKDGKIIELWVKERDGAPAKVKGTKDLLRVKFDVTEDDLENITWYEFFEIFKKNDLTFLYDDSEHSRSCKFVD